MKPSSGNSVAQLPSTTTTDRAHMIAALALARRGLGETWPNPTVGCVLVKDGRVVGRGRTSPGGRPHAEIGALSQAGADARGATAYVTLEPCSHYGKTPPCADALIQAGIARVVVANPDPDPRVNGAGVGKLRTAGISVELGLCGEEAAVINAGFFKRVREGAPLVTLKIASSLDGRIATNDGKSRWITGAPARTLVHLLRAENDAVLIGSGTATADNPELTCRLRGLEGRSPLRIVLDSYLRLPLTAKLVATAEEIPTWILTRPDADADRMDAFRQCGVDIIPVPPGRDGRIDLTTALSVLGERGLTSSLVEGGGRMSAALFRERLVDRLAWFHAPMVLGGDGLPASVAFGVAKLSDAPRFTLLESRTIGNDILTLMTRE